jgi:hypothetical protein
MTGKSYPIHIDKIPEWITMLKQHIDKDFWTVLLAQGKNITRSKHHPWAHPYYEYRRKNKKNMDTVIMASQMFSLVEFIDYWTNPAIIKQVISKIRNPNEFRSLIFEFEIAFHFKKCLGYQVELTSIPIDENRIGDMRIVNNSNIIEVECSRKRDKPERSLFNLANYLHKEARQFSGENPGIIAIHVPEASDWRAISENRELGKYIQEEFKRDIFRHINAVFYSCDQDPKRKFNSEYFRESYDTSMDMLYYENPNAIFKLPNWFQVS